MKNIIHFLILISSVFCFEKIQAFTLNNNVNLSFAGNEVKVNVASGFCTNIGYSETELLSIVQDAVNEYWNKAPVSRLKLREGSLQTVSSLYHTALICNAGTNCEPNPSLAVASDILISCNNNTSNFSSNAVLAVTVPNNTSGSTIDGSLIILNDLAAGNIISTKSRDELVAIIAHEIGHAIGLGHSPVRNSLMYYAVISNRRSLGQDDMDGLAYLYPKQQPISCGSIDTDYKKSKPMWPGFFIGLMICYLAFIKLRPRLAHSDS